MNFTRLSHAPIERLAVFHAEYLSGKLSGLGTSYIRFFYSAAMRLEDTIGWAAFQEEDLVGFVMGSLNGGTFLKRLIQKNRLAWMSASLRGAVTHPLRFGRIAASILKESPHASQPLPEIHFIAVRPDQRGRHVGAELIQLFGKELAERGGSRFELSVGQDNPQAIRFYEKLGGKRGQNYQAAGSPMTRFSFELKC